MWFWMHDGTIGGWWWMGVLGWVWMAAFWAAVVALVVWGVRRLTYANGAPDGRPVPPLDIARERYARGDITRQEYEELRKDLTS